MMHLFAQLRIRALGFAVRLAPAPTPFMLTGPGSSIDTAKAMIACYARGRRPEDLDGYFKIRAPVLPFFAVPTTAGSGSEVTIASVVSDPGAGRKFAIVDNKLIPAAIALDPNLMSGLPAHVTAATGMDALTHAIESYLSTLATPATQALSVAAARAILRDLPRACENGSDIAARQSLAIASCMAGMAFTKVSVGYVHAIAHQLGPLYHLPHGYLNAILLPYVLDFYLDDATARMAGLARACGLGQDREDDRALAMSLIGAIRELNASVGIPSTIEQITDADIPEIVRRALAEAHGTYPVPAYMSVAECTAVVKRAAGRA